MDFSSEFDNTNYGSGPEAALMGMIVNTLTSLRELRRCITVEGRVLSFAYRELGPFSWNGSLVRKLPLP